MTTTTVTWYVARAGGMVAFTLLTISVLLGLGLSSRARLRYWPRFALEDVHRFAALLAGTFIAVHVGAILLDTYVPFSIAGVLVPCSASYRPLFTALGVVAMELLVALAVTNRLRKRLPHRFWRLAHYLNFAVWSLALVHGIAGGTDSGTVWALALYITAAGSVLGMTVGRILNRRPQAAVAPHSSAATSRTS